MGSSQVLIRTLTSLTLDKFLGESEFAVVDFSAEWCPPCRALEEALLELAPKYHEKIAFGQVDIDSEEELADRFDVESVPHLVFFKNKEINEVRRGFRCIETLQNTLERLIEGSPQDLTSLFANGKLWDLDDETSVDIMKDIDRAVLFFTGNKPNRNDVSQMISFAKEYRKMIFFGLFDSRRCPSMRSFFKVSRGPATAVFLHKRRVVSRIVGDASEQEYRTHIDQLLEESL
jgi:thioredoxin 1